MAIKKVLILVVVISVVFPLSSTVATANVDGPCEVGEITRVTEQNSTFGIDIRYILSISDEKDSFCVHVENHGEHKAPSTFTAIIDGKVATPTMPTLEPGESVTVRQNTTPYLDVRRDNHTIVLGALGDESQYNFTRVSTPSNPTIPSPHITDVQAVRYESNDSTALRVEIFNPAKRPYLLSAQVETFGTDGDFKNAAPQPNQTSTVVIPLKESTDDVVAGKVRIFGEFGQPETRYDQKEFMSKKGEETNYWDIDFDRVPGKVDTDSYSNETARVEYQGYDPNMLSPLQRKLGAVATVLLFVGAVWWRRRRKYR
jgi:hypothetical protein